MAQSLAKRGSGIPVASRWACPGKTCYRFREREEGVLRGRNKFVTYEARIARRGEGACDGRVVEFLPGAELMATWHACGMKVSEILDVFSHGSDHVAFHDLHVVDVIKEFEAGVS